MHYNAKLFAAIIGGSAVVTLGALSVGIIEGQSAPASAAGSPQMTLGATTTVSTPPNAPAVGEAAPSIKGPAPLPSEEQGLPG
ncbi:MAG: hypothetical protein JWR13_1493 [Mycobacterium sp.]|jgi:hypothetical protein|nr:hypothetical protein [Mycobacterium sp.]